MSAIASYMPARVVSGPDYATAVRNIIHKHVDEQLIKRKDEPPKGWLNQLLRGLTNFHLHPVQIALGKKFEYILREVAALTYDVPEFIAGHGVTRDEAERYVEEPDECLNKGDIPILTRLNIGELEVQTSQFWEQFRELRQKDKQIRLTHKKFEDFSNQALRSVPTQETISVLHVDFAIKADGYVLSELRSSGYTDARKSYDTLKQLLTCYVAVGQVKKKLYLGVVTNSTDNKASGEWKGHLGGQVAKEVILMEDQLWNTLAPPGVSFGDFKSLLERRINSLLPKKQAV